MADYYTLLTNAGLAYEAACKANGVPIKLSKFSVGDGNGSVYNPDATMTGLRREVWRGDINALLQDANNPSWLVAELTLPDSVGGWYIREAGVWTDSGILYAVVKYPESYKPVLATTGAGKEFYIRAIFQTSNAPNVVLAVDESIVKATRAWVVDYVAGELAKLDYKQSVRVATTGNITLSGAQTIDSVPVVAGDRVLVKNQTNAWLNGIYVVANGAWIRAADADASVEVTSELMVAVEEGSANGDSLWHLTTNAPIVLGTTPLAFAQIYTAAQVVTLLAAKAPLDSPALKGTPTTPTPAAGTNNQQVSNTAFVMTEIAKAISNLIGGAGPALDQLNELAAALGNDPNFATTIATALGLKAPLASPALSGTPTAPRPGLGSNTDQIQTAAGVLAQLAAFGIGARSLVTLADLDDKTIPPGIYMCGNETKGTLPDRYGVVFVPSQALGTNVSNWANQVFFGTTGGVFFRGSVNMGAWGSWRTFAMLEALAKVATTGKFSDLQDQNDHVMRGTAGAAWKTLALQQVDARGSMSLEYRNPTGTTVMSMQGLSDGSGGYRPRMYYTKAGDVGADRRIYWGGVNDADIVEFAGPMQVRQGGYLLDKTLATLNVKSDTSDGTGGLTVSNFAPTLAMVDRSEGARSSRWRTDANGLYLDWDNADQGATWNPPLLTVLPVGEVLSKSPNNWRIMSGNYGTFWRNDGASLYLMITASGDPAGPWSPLRPLAIDLASGRMVCSNGLGITTAGRGDNSTNAASTAFVMEAVGNRAGAVDFFARADAPFGYLKANGAAVSRATYAALFAAIGTLHGAGDGSTTFNLPDMRGEFPRGWDDGRGIDASRVIGSLQAGQNAAHTHGATVASAGAHNHATTVAREYVEAVVNNQNAVFGDQINEGTNDLPTSTAGAHTHTVTIASSGGNESRPRNIALLACIKF